VLLSSETHLVVSEEHNSVERWVGECSYFKVDEFLSLVNMSVKIIYASSTSVMSALLIKPS